MDLKKRKHFTLKTEGSFLVSLCLCYSLQTMKYSALVELFNATLWRFFKNSSKFSGKRLWWRPLSVNFQLFKYGSATDVFLSVFRTPFHVCCQTLKKRYSFGWWHCRVQKFHSLQIYSKESWFFLLGAPKYLLAAKFFYSLFAQRSSLPLVIRGRSGAPATSKMECFETIVNSWKPLTIISKRSILDVAGALDPPLVILDVLLRNNSYLLGVRFLINNRVTTGPSWKLGKKSVFFPNRTWTQKNETFG